MEVLLWVEELGVACRHEKAAYSNYLMTSGHENFRILWNCLSSVGAHQKMHPVIPKNLRNPNKINICFSSASLPSVDACAILE